MTDPLRFERSSPGETGRERDARIEELLLDGLDHYFAGRHELAINIWTRVLFLDRSHGKARAYIDRARGALAERQREAEELLHSGAAALHRGDRSTARQLLTSADRVGASEEAATLLHRLDRLEAAAPAGNHSRSTPSDAEAERVSVTPSRDARLAWVITGILAGVLLAALAGGYLWLVSDPFDLTVARNAAPAAQPAPLPVPTTCEIRLARARTLFAEARLHDALAQLEAGDPDDLHKASFDELRATIQRQLIEAARAHSGFAPVETARRGGPRGAAVAGGRSR